MCYRHSITNLYCIVDVIVIFGLYLEYMPSTNWKGQLAVSKVEVRAIELGYIPNRPLMDCRYDLIIDKNSQLFRVQVKYASGNPTNSFGSVNARLAYETRRRRQVISYSDDEVDALVVYIPQLDKLCWFPTPVFVGKKMLSIRIIPSKNNQKSNIIEASKYFW